MMSLQDKLELLKKLFDDGLIDQGEYDAKKSEVLEEL